MMTTQHAARSAVSQHPAQSAASQSVTLHASILSRAILDSAQKTIAEFRARKYEHELLAAVILRALLPIIPAETPLKVNEVALALGLSTGAVYMLRSKGDLKAEKYGRNVRFPAGAVRDYLLSILGPNVEAF